MKYGHLLNERTFIYRVERLIFTKLWFSTLRWSFILIIILVIVGLSVVIIGLATIIRLSVVIVDVVIVWFIIITTTMIVRLTIAITITILTFEGGGFITFLILNLFSMTIATECNNEYNG